MTVSQTAPAKINLTLHVTALLADGYHELDSLVVFGQVADYITVKTSETLSLVINGPEAAELTADKDNLVLRAAALMAKGRGATITLTKNLPVASGIGGGSADAAATLRALARLWDESLPGPDEILSLGADVPVCLANKPTRMSGVGQVLTPTLSTPQSIPMVLVNPRVPVPTSKVFRQLENKNGSAMPSDIPSFSNVTGMACWLRGQRNDLQVPAIEIQPVIANVLQAIGDTNSLFSRMSGSGATCFGLYETFADAKVASELILRKNPGWWVVVS